MTRRTRLTAVFTCALAAAGTSAAVAGAQSGGEQSASVDLTAGPFAMKFDAVRPAGAKMGEVKSGSFSGRLRMPGGDLATVQGPMTCLDVVGNRIGAFYPVDKAVPSALGFVMKGAYISIQTDGKGHAQGMTFMPMATRKMATCPPMGGMLPAQGSAQANGG